MLAWNLIFSPRYSISFIPVFFNSRNKTKPHKSGLIVLEEGLNSLTLEITESLKQNKNCCTVETNYFLIIIHNCSNSRYTTAQVLP